MSYYNCSYDGNGNGLNPGLLPPTTQIACTVPVEGGNITAILSHCCGDAAVVPYPGVLLPNTTGGNCLQYCNLSTALNITTARSCLSGRGVCWTAEQLAKSGGRRDSEG